ncbi:hypothetical protein JMJ56_15880 [Belnapia sp. T18]|uniref:SGNH/GDSL hydrolase family protein n=1 Tax=Belnapia arida TaxID=2804533 RepID=A0ABS1U4A9_9PROT|nr:hypothetical protein [Belnapia arida]MBL6079499.1 hypothetical protein [Belnapia arida]
MSATPIVQAAPKPVRPGYLLAFLGSLLGMFALYYGVLLTLSATGNLPPPAFSNSLCIDEKLHVLREKQAGTPTLLVVGSSVAWRHFDGETLLKATPQTEPLNGAFCGLSVNQTGFVTEWLLDHHPSVRDVVMIASPQDFQDCDSKPTAVFDRGDADDYVFGRATPWFYYTRYFSLSSLARNAATIADKRSGANRIDPLVFDRFGSGPLAVEEGRGQLLYGAVDGPHPACLSALSQLAGRVQGDGKRLMVAMTPLHPQWRAMHDADGAVLDQFSAAIRATLGESGAQYWDSNQSHEATGEEFFDAIHLRWAGVPRFTAALQRALGMATAAPPPGPQSSLSLSSHNASVKASD